MLLFITLAFAQETFDVNGIHCTNTSNGEVICKADKAEAVTYIPGQPLFCTEEQGNLIVDAGNNFVQLNIFNNEIAEVMSANLTLTRQLDNDPRYARLLVLQEQLDWFYTKYPSGVIDNDKHYSLYVSKYDEYHKLLEALRPLLDKQIQIADKAEKLAIRYEAWVKELEARGEYKKCIPTLQYKNILQK
jgi:hypothetical protein